MYIHRYCLLVAQNYCFFTEQTNSSLYVEVFMGLHVVEDGLYVEVFTGLHVVEGSLYVEVFTGLPVVERVKRF